MKVIRLSSQQYRFWRSNQLFLVDHDGVTVIRPATLVEAQEGRPVRMLATKTDEAGEPVISEQTGKPIREPKVFELKSSRELLKQDFLTRHGECIVMGHGNRRLAVVRDPTIERAGPESKNSPPPANCNCRDWGEPHPGRHHPQCQWNSVAPPHERATKDDQLKTMPAGFVASPIAGHMVPKDQMASAEVDPSECFCRNWKLFPDNLTPGKQHHPDCQYSTTFVSHAQQAREVTHEAGSQRVDGGARVSGTPNIPDKRKEKEPSSLEQAMQMVGTESVPSSATASAVGPVMTAGRPVPSPENCVCKDFAPEGLSPDGQHKPICEFYDAYKRAHPTPPRPRADGKTSQLSSPDGSEVQHGEAQPSQPDQPVSRPRRPMIVDLDTSKPLREASLDEEEQALTRLKADGFPLVLIDGHQYGVLFPEGSDVPPEWIVDDESLQVEQPAEEKPAKVVREKPFINSPLHLPPKPEDCSCKDFAETEKHWRTPGHHHTICVHYEAYRELHPEISTERPADGERAVGYGQQGTVREVNGQSKRSRKKKAKKTSRKKKATKRARR